MKVTSVTRRCQRRAKIRVLPVDRIAYFCYRLDACLHLEPATASAAPSDQRTHVSQWTSVVTHLDPRYGGLSAVVPQLTSSLAGTGHLRMALAAFCSPDELYSPLNYQEVTFSEWPSSRGAWMLNRGLQARFRELLQSGQGVHIHGIWEQSTAIAAGLARRQQLPYIVSAHGMLDRWALNTKWLKKMIYAALIERANLQGAICLHALTRAEANDYRRFGCRAPIAVIPNGVRLPEQASAEKFFAQHPTLKGKRIVLFLGRLHAKKGVDLLIRCWKEVISRHPDAHLVLAGPDFEGTRAKISTAVAEEGVGHHVLFTGMLRDDAKWSALAAAECFVLPSFSEGLSVAALEAMGLGLPVILSEHCNLPEVTELEAGWIVPAKIAPFKATLLDMLNNSSRTNACIGARGRAFVRQHYNWNTVAAQMGELYRWAEGGPTPAQVELLPGDRSSR